MRPNRLQVTYQRNMSLATVIVAIIFTVCGLLISFLEGPPELSEVKVVRNVLIPDRDNIESSDKAAKRSVGGYQPYADQHEGFLGFIRLDRHLSDKPILPESKVAPLVYTHEPAPSLDIGELSFSELEGEDTGVYVSDDIDYDEFEDEPEPVNLGIEVVYKVDPEYPPVARMDTIKGKVSLLIYVDEEGEVSVFPEGTIAKNYTIQTKEFTVKGDIQDSFDYVVAFIEPTGELGSYFAKNLIKVLPTWRFRPEIRDGRVVPNFLIVTYNFCMGNDCLKLLEIHSLNN